jgi:hypothetical protein
MYITTNASLMCLTLAGVIIVDKTENSLSTSQATMTLSVMNAKVDGYVFWDVVIVLYEVD